MVVVPNVMGFCTWSPPLDSFGNSVKGVQFCQELVQMFNFHHYDDLRHVPHKKDPRRLKFETQGLKVVSLLFSAASGDVSAMRRSVVILSPSLSHSLSSSRPLKSSNKLKSDLFTGHTYLEWI